MYQETIRAHVVKLFGGGEQGKTRYFDELQQVTAILESIKNGQNNQYETSRTTSGSNTELSRVSRVQAWYTQIEALHKKIETELQAELDDMQSRFAAELRDHAKTKERLAGQMTGTAMYQRIAESVGLVKTDQDDVLDTPTGGRKRRHDYYR